MTKNPLVSVIIPVYNRPVQLKTAIQSVLSQEFQDFEIIVVDDCSLKPVLPIIGDLKHIRVIRHEVNRGAAAARNTGIRAAKGSLIGFLDSDDFWLPQKLQNQVAVFKENKNLDLCFCAYNLVTISGLGNKLIYPYTPKVPKDGNWHRHLLVGCDFGPGSTMLARKKLFSLYGFFNEEYTRSEDWEWFFRVSKNKKININILDKVLVTVNNFTISSARDVELANNKIIREFGVEFGQYKSFGKKALSKRYLETSIYLFKEREIKKALPYFLKGFRIYPFHRAGYYALIFEAAFRIPIGDLWFRLKNHRMVK